MKKITVILAGHNPGERIYPSIQSLLDQSLECQIIAADCGSTDDSRELLADCAAQFPEDIRVVTVESTGYGAGFNAGLELAEGEYVAFLRWGDAVEGDFCKSLSDAAGGADICGGSYSGKPQSQDQRLECLKAMGGGPRIYRREFLTEQGLRFPEDMEFGELVFEFLTVLEADSFAEGHAPMSLGDYTPGRNDRRWYARLDVPQALLEQCRQRGLLERYPDLVEFRWLVLQMGNLRRVCLDQFDVPDPEQLGRIRLEVLENYPHYRKGKYYQHTLRDMRYYLDKLMESPKKAIAARKKDGWVQLRAAMAERFLG